MKPLDAGSFSTSKELLERIVAVLDGSKHVPLLVLQLPEFAEIAWRTNKRAARRLERATSVAFYHAARTVVREEDILSHDAASDWFAVAMLGPSRHGAHIAAMDARSALERIAAGIALATGSRMQTGWCPLTCREDCDDISVAIRRALDRGARERERYEFLAAVGHELRTPLTSIRGYIETILDGDVDAATARKFLSTARNEALRLGRLVDGMLDFSMLDLSPGTLLDRTSDVSQAVRAAVEALAPIARERRIAMRATVPPDVFGGIDADACMHAVINLIENALKYGRFGGRVDVALRVCPRIVEIAVDDDGPGVAETERDAIFELHARGGSVDSRPGRGIGLAIVRRIAERVAGRAWAEHSSLGGARFVFEIPLA
ncbi:MAG: HAMP domain-containing histidine kinase [Candidatus Eremiobacteraeota bacterium]|nr:HAMP domain-containing histidine kinase [Candidatus Eremiobacteraeota bacterium]